MSKKQRISPIVDFQINTDIVSGDLPKRDEVEKTVAALTGKTVVATEKKEKPLAKAKVVKPETHKIAMPKAKPEVIQEIKYQIKYGRPQKLIATGRTKFTTMLQPDIVKELKMQAIKKGITVADLLETVLENYLSKKS
jgi:hypothetical protein